VNSSGGTLHNRRIALAETRELDLMAQMLEKEGATVVRCPLVSIQDTPDAAPVAAWINRLIAGKLHDVIFYTGEGMRRLAGFAERAGVRAEFLAALGRVRKITRGPKPVRALREVGLSPDLTAEEPTTAGLIATLDHEPLHGRVLGLQIYGQAPNAEMLAYLKGRGAAVDVVAPYVYASKADDERVRDLIGDMVAGNVAAMLFTSSPQVQRLVDVAESAGLADTLRQAFARTRIGAIGPVVAAELERRGIRADAMPDTAYTMKPLVRAVARIFAP
jgi:uroporphyrinogen-III synthase